MPACEVSLVMGREDPPIGCLRLRVGMSARSTQARAMSPSTPSYSRWRAAGAFWVFFGP